MSESVLRGQLLVACRRLVAEGLVERTWGNVSCRLSESEFLITPSGRAYESLQEGDFAVVNCHTLAGPEQPRPSSEKAVHAAAYRRFKGAAWVLHTHQDAASALGCCPAAFSTLRLSEDELGQLGGLALAGYGLPGSQELADNVEKELAAGANCVLMACHGALAVGCGIEQAFERALLAERVCARALRAGREFKVGPVQPGLQAALGTALGLGCACIVESAALEYVGQGGLPPMLDDFCQIAGGHAASLPEECGLEELVAALRGKNCAIIGKKALCAASSAEELSALCALVQKNAVAYANAVEYGDVRPILPEHAAAMRSMYVTDYSLRK